MKRYLAVLVFLLGVCATVNAADYTGDPVIFVHGINGDINTWKDLSDTLDRNGWDFGGCPKVHSAVVTGVYNACSPEDFYIQRGNLYRMEFSSNQDLSLEEQGSELGNIIREVLAVNGTPYGRVIVVAHSMGGLAARAYIQYHADDFGLLHNRISKLIMVGTPHQGSNLARHYRNVCWGSAYKRPCSEAIKTLIPDSDALQDLNSRDHWTTDAPYFVSLRAHGERNSLKNTDGVVTEKSQDLWLVGGNVLYPMEHADRTVTVTETPACSPGFKVPGSNKLIHQVHTCETTDGSVWSAVIKEIIGSTRERPILDAYVGFLTGPVKVGDVIELSVGAFNNGSNRATGVQLVGFLWDSQSPLDFFVTLANDVSFVNLPRNCFSPQKNIVVCDLPNLDEGEDSGIFTLQVKVTGVPASGRFDVGFNALSRETRGYAYPAQWSTGAPINP